jgi:hypothetical protein
VKFQLGILEHVERTQGYSALFKLPSCALPYDPIVLLVKSLRVSFCDSNNAVSV